MNFFRIVKFALQDIGRNLSLSFMTVLILVLMLLSINTLLVVRVLTQQAVTSINNQLDVSVHFVPGAEEQDIKELEIYINSFPEVDTVTYLNAEEVLTQFKETNKNKPKILESLAQLDQNPFGASFIIKTHNPADYEKVIAALNVPEYETIIQDKDFVDTQVGITRIHNITSQVERFTLILTGLFAIISFIIIFNTVRVAIYTQRMEINIKKLVGASNWFVRGPYIIESFVFSLISTLISGVIVYFVVKAIEPQIAGIFSQTGILTNYYHSHILELALAQFGAVLALTTLTSLLAMRRYLKA